MQHFGAFIIKMIAFFKRLIVLDFYSKNLGMNHRSEALQIKFSIKTFEIE